MKTDLKKSVRSIPDFPKPGILFRDFIPLMEDRSLRKELADQLCNLVMKVDYFDPYFDILAGLDSRGIWVATLLAQRLECNFLPIRKAGKLPPPVCHADYQLEYGTASFEVSTLSLKPGTRVILVDDLLATGGSLLAATQLIRQCGGEVLGALVVIELTDLPGRKNLQEKGVETFSLLQY